MAAVSSLEELFHAKREILSLELLTPELSLEREFRDPDISTPGLALAGYVERFPAARMQVLGETEMSFLESLDPKARSDRLRTFFGLGFPAAFITKGQEVPEDLLDAAEAAGVPVFRSYLTTKDFFGRIKPYLEMVLAPSTSVHGSLADVYGVGLLFIGRSGIGKSECVLDLIERGHRLVADDLVIASRRGHDILIGKGHELQRHHMEIRGIGIIDIPALFGVQATRRQKRIEVVVQLEEWDDSHSYDRTGLDRQEAEILGVTLPKVTVPLNPGKNITVISEVVAMNHLLRYEGRDSAAEFNAHLQGALQQAPAYLEEDYE
ncbi:MAG: HPr(Ser) kinase/phosphatase [Gemmatimonadota bacterium]